MTKNILVLGLEDFNLLQMQALRNAGEYRFYSLVDYKDVKVGPHFPVQDILERAERTLSTFPGPVDAIVGYWDFPVSTMLPILREKCGLPGPSLEAVLKCEHKYWSRLLQKEAVPGHVPRFCAVNPFAENPRAAIPLDYPFWLKPVKSASSALGFNIQDQRDFDHAIEVIRSDIYRFAEPFNDILDRATIPADIRAIDGFHCIAEAIISEGEQCTQEGYVYRGDVRVYGTVDSIREGRHRSCFSRYQYPSRLPRRVMERMDGLTERVLQHIGYDDGTFNIEYYWDSKRDHLWLLEINARISKSHCPLFHMVDGDYHHAVNIEIALGRRPDFPYREGRYTVAAKYMLRRYENAVVQRVPNEQDLANVQEVCPEALVQIHVHPGMRLSELLNQDSYSYEVAVLFLGADSESALERKYRRCVELLNLEFAPVSTSGDS